MKFSKWDTTYENWFQKMSFLIQAEMAYKFLQDLLFLRKIL